MAIQLNFFEKSRNEQIITQSNKWNSFKFIDLFAGIGGIRLGFEALGGRCVFSSEIDKLAQQTYQENFGEKPFGDIRLVDAKDIPDFNILLAGFPCQSFSIIGKKEGFNEETEGTLFFEVERILKEKKPEAFLLENVKNLISHDNGNTFKVILSHLEKLGYFVHYKVLNSFDFGVPQRRERIYIVGFKRNIPFEFPVYSSNKATTLEDILEVTVDKKYYVKDSIKQSRVKRLKDKGFPKPYISHENMSKAVTPHAYSSALRANASAHYILVNDERHLTEREMLRLQGFPEDFKINHSYSTVKKQCGNSVTVPVIKAIANNILCSLRLYDNNKI